jgi:hypothetical protein
MYVRKTISNLLSMLEELIWENINSNTILCLFKTMQAYLQRNYFQGVFFKIRFPLLTMCLKMNFKVVFYKVFPLMSKDYFVNPISNIFIMQENPFGQFTKPYLQISFIMKTCSLTVLKCF